MNKYKVGDVVIISSGQAGTIWHITDGIVAVILRCKDIWYGPEYEIRLPSSKKELKACPIELDKWKKKTIPPKFT